MGCQTLRTRRKVLNDFLENEFPDVCTKDIVNKHLTNSLQILIINLRGHSRKHVKPVVKPLNNNKRDRVIKRSIIAFLLHSTFNMTGAEIVSVSSEFDIFKHRLINTSALGTVETMYKSIASVDQNNLEFIIHYESDTYIDVDSKFIDRGKLASGAWKDVDLTDTTAGTIISPTQCTANVTPLNGVAVRLSIEHYNYCSNLETPYGTDAAASHLTSTYWYLDSGDMQLCEPLMENHTATKNKIFLPR